MFPTPKTHSTAHRTIAALFAVFLLCICSSFASAELAAGFDAALDSDGRPAADKERDAARQSKAVLEFLEIGAGMTVLDVLASTGWYSEVLSAAVGSDGKVIAFNTNGRRDRSEAGITARAERLGNIDPLFADVGSLSLGTPVDAAITALNLHDLNNRGSEATQAFLGDVLRALKPGGVFGVIDHEGVAGQDNKALHRMEVSAAVAALESAGFVVEEVSDLLNNPADDHTLAIRDPSLGRNTDRFLIKARKPD
jgi:predicted methyltransferase